MTARSSSSTTPFVPRRSTSSRRSARPRRPKALLERADAGEEGDRSLAGCRAPAPRREQDRGRRAGLRASRGHGVGRRRHGGLPVRGSETPRTRVADDEGILKIGLCELAPKAFDVRDFVRTTLKRGTRGVLERPRSRPHGTRRVPRRRLRARQPLRGVASQPLADRGQDPRLAGDRRGGRGRSARRRGLALPERVGERRAGEVGGGQAVGGVPRRPGAGSADRRDRHRLRHAGG